MKQRLSTGHICSLTKYKARGYASGGSGKLFMNSNWVAWDKLVARGRKWKWRWSMHVYSFFLRDELTKISWGKLPAVQARPVDQQRDFAHFAAMLLFAKKENRVDMHLLTCNTLKCGGFIIHNHNLDGVTIGNDWLTGDQLCSCQPHWLTDSALAQLARRRRQLPTVLK